MKHLLCHLWPKREPGTWRKTIDELISRWDLFDGKKVIAVASCDKSHTADDVQKLLPKDAIVLQFTNNPNLREVVTFVPLLEQVQFDIGGTIFYCHGKASTHDYRNVTSHAWADLMWHVMLDHPGLVQCALENHAIAGCFRRRQRFGLTDGYHWHFSGSFFWARCRDIFAKPGWREIDLIWYGNESWPGLHFSLEESVCLFLDHCGDLYSRSYWRSTVLPAFRLWQERVHLLGQSSKMPFRPKWLLRPELHFPSLTGTDGSDTTAPAKKSWRRIRRFLKRAAKFFRA